MASISRRTIIGSAMAAMAISTAELGGADVADAATSGSQPSIGALDPNLPYQSSRNLFKRGSYFAQGSVATRSVQNMPLDPNSAVMAQTMADMPTNPDLPYAVHQGGWTTTGANTTSYNLPIYVVNSSKGCPNTYVKLERGVLLQPYLTGDIPMPPYFAPAGGGDSSAAIFDLGTGRNREYYGLDKQSDGTWTSSYAGFSDTPEGIATMGKTNPSLELTKIPLNPGDPNTKYQIGSSAVVAMHNSAMQIGFLEMEDGAINHAIDFTFCEAGKGFSWPAQQGDGNYTGPGIAPVEGQWGRIDPSVDLDTLGLGPFTLLIARAAQRYGIMGGDHNLYCHGFNFEHPAGDLANGIDPWERIGKIYNLPNMNSASTGFSLNDFPWHLTQWAPKDWKGMDQADLSPLPVITYDSSWKYVKSGNMDPATGPDYGPLGLQNQSGGNRGYSSVQTYTKTMNFSKSMTLSAPVHVTSYYENCAQTISVFIDGSRTPAATIKSNVPVDQRRLKFTAPAGQHTIRIQFSTDIAKLGTVTDSCLLGAFYEA